MSIAEDIEKLIDLGQDLLEGKKTPEELIDEAAANARPAPPRPSAQPTAAPAPRSVRHLALAKAADGSTR
jgi:hypothetical protein